MHQPTILFLAHEFHPSSEIGARRPTALARYLVEKGMRVVVVSAFGDADIAAESEVLPGIMAIPVPRPARLLIDKLVSVKRRFRAGGAVSGTSSRPAEPVSRDGTMARRSRLRDMFFRVVYFVDAHKKWGWRAARAATLAGRKYRAMLVLSSSPPPSVLLAGTLTARRLGIPHIADLRDPWTDVLASEAPYGRLELRLLRALEAWVMQSAAAITSTGAMVAEALMQRYPRDRQKMHVIRNGYDGEIQPSIFTTGGRLVILFAGELYAGRDPFPLLHALENLLVRPEIDASRICITFMGRTATYRGASLHDWLRGKRCAASVRIVSQQPRHVVDQAVADATVLLNLAQKQHLSIPAKTFEQLASGREILLICESDSETAQLMTGIRGVHRVDPEDPQALERALLELYHRHVVDGRVTAPAERDVQGFARTTANRRFWSVLNAAAKLDEAMQQPRRVDATAHSSDGKDTSARATDT